MTIYIYIYLYISTICIYNYIYIKCYAVLCPEAGCSCQPETIKNLQLTSPGVCRVSATASPLGLLCFACEIRKGRCWLHQGIPWCFDGGLTNKILVS